MSAANKRRAKSGRAVLRAWNATRDTAPIKGSPATLDRCVDATTDILHAAHERGLDTAVILRRAAAHIEWETGDED